MQVEVVFSRTRIFHSLFDPGRTSEFVAGVPYYGSVIESGWYAGAYRVIRFDTPVAEVILYERDLYLFRPVVKIALPT